MDITALVKDAQRFAAQLARPDDEARAVLVAESVATMLSREMPRNADAMFHLKVGLMTALTAYVHSRTEI